MAKKIKQLKNKKGTPEDIPFDREQFNELLKQALAYDPRKKKLKK
jgi:hypothetical protein